MLHRGLSLIDVVVGTSLIVIIFLGMFAGFRASIGLNALAKARATATALANERIEYMRGLTYEETGTIGGIPAGVIPQIATTTLNGLEYEMRTLVTYIDDAQDGAGASDTNGITTDYKKIKVDVSYSVNEKEYEVSLTSTRAPRSLETSVNGGTLKIRAIDASGLPVPSALVRIQNSATNPAIDTTVLADTSGIVFLPGAPTSTSYGVSVTKAGFSTAETYTQSASNVSPSPGLLTVVKSLTTESTFAIDYLSSLLVRTFSPIVSGVYEDIFSDATGLLSYEDVDIVGGDLLLHGEEGVYVSSGTALSVAVAPTYLYAWREISATSTTPISTTIRFQVWSTNGGSQLLIPDNILPNNSVGFTGPVIDISGISPISYPSLHIGAILESSDSNNTPSIDEWGISYERGPIPLPNVSFDGIGAKTIGATSGGSPIYKTTFSHTTDGEGEYRIEDLEYDSYAIDVPSYDIADACAPLPFSLLPNVSETLNLILEPLSAHSLRVVVRSNNGTLLPDASVEVTKTGVDLIENTSACGQAYFGDMASASTYTITVTKGGYTFTPDTNVTISGATVVTISAE